MTIFTDQCGSTYSGGTRLYPHAFAYSISRGHDGKESRRFSGCHLYCIEMQGATMSSGGASRQFIAAIETKTLRIYWRIFMHFVENGSSRFVEGPHRRHCRR